jgi:hypothetical protein
LTTIGSSRRNIAQSGFIEAMAVRKGGTQFWTLAWWFQFVISAPSWWCSLLIPCSEDESCHIWRGFEMGSSS